MQIKPFLLDHWLDEHGGAAYDLACSTGPAWTVRELFELMPPEEKESLWDARATYRPAAGTEGLREAIAAMEGVQPDEVQVVTGASEALHILFFMAAEPDANVIVPTPSFPTFTALPEAVGVETRTYRLRPENDFQIDDDEVKNLANDQTRLILVNSPHNPTGAVVDAGSLSELHDFAAGRGIPFIVDQVYHPIYYDTDWPTAAALPHATVLCDFSKARGLSGLRVGWFVERNKRRMEHYWNTRAYFTISNGLLSEALAEVAIRHHDKFYKRGQEVGAANLALLDKFFDEQKEVLSWVRPQGGFTGFPRLVSGEDSRPMCRAAAEQGVLLAPGDCFGYPPHFRLGFGACVDGFPQALEVLFDVMAEVTSH